MLFSIVLEVATEDRLFWSCPISHIAEAILLNSSEKMRREEPPHTSCLDPDSKRPKRSFISNIAFKLRHKGTFESQRDCALRIVSPRL